MSGPQAFRVEVSATRAWRRLSGVLGVGSAAVLAVWAGQLASGSAALAAWLGVFGLTAAGALAWRPVPDPVLDWDGRGWRLNVGGPGRDGCRVDLGVAIDLGGWMLLESVEAGTGVRRWLAVSRGQDRAEWHLLRCAVYSPRPHPGAPAAPEIPPPE